MATQTHDSTARCFSNEGGIGPASTVPLRARSGGAAGLGAGTRPAPTPRKRPWRGLLACAAGLLLGPAAADAADTGPAAPRPTLSLDGTWDFATDPERIGEKEKWFQPGVSWPTTPRPGHAPATPGAIRVPGVWDNQGYGAETPKVRHNHVGLGWYRRQVVLPSEWSDRRVFLCIGGAHRYAKVWVNGVFLGEHIGYLSAFEHELTGRAPAGQPATVVIQVDSQQRWDVDTLFGAADLADYMDVAWGGIWGHVWLEARAAGWLRDLYVQPRVATASCKATVVLEGDLSLARSVQFEVLDARGNRVSEARSALEAPPRAGAPVQLETSVSNAQLWSPDRPYLYRARVTLLDREKAVDRVEARFGMRQLRIDGAFVMLNGQRLFLRGYGDDHIYPEQMAMPSDKELHLQRLRLIKSYGFNHVRHHSTLMPPEYYEACDEVGIMPTAEFPIAYEVFLPGGETWKKNTPPGAQAAPAWETYCREWAAAIKRYRNHASIFAWVMGNELWNGIPQRREFRRIARELDPDRPFADTDGVTEMWQRILDPKNDRDTLDVHFLMFDVFRNPLDLPDKFQTRPALKPIVSHESGNYVTFTRPSAADAFRHNVKPFWMTEGRAKLERLGLLAEAEDWAAKSERLYLLLHKTNLEALRKNPAISGYHWWLFQDYWTTANGLVDHYFRPKAIAPDEVRAFNNDVVLLEDGLDLTYRGGAALQARLRVSNFSTGAFDRARCVWQLRAADRVLSTDQRSDVSVGQGELAECGRVTVILPDVERPTRLQLQATWIAGEQPARTWRNEWSAWVFPKAAAPGPSPAPLYGSAAQVKRWPGLRLTPLPREGPLPAQAVYLSGRLDRRLADAVERGASLVLLQAGRAFASRPLTYRSSWWKAGDDLNANLCGTWVYDHPVTRAFAPEGWCDAGWFHLLEGGRKIVLEGLPARPNVILRALPSLRSVQDEAVLFEVGCGKGLVLASGLNHEKARGRPENDWLLAQMLTHAATSAPPRATWPRAALPVADDAEAGEALSGFEKLTRNEGEEGVWYSYREDNVKMPVCRQTQAGHLVEWETAAAPAEGTNDFLTFVFAGGLGYQSEPKTDGFVFLVNGAEQVRFDLPEQTNRWQSADGRVTLRFAALRKPPQDQLGLFTATLARGLWAPGQPCRFAVRSLGQGSRRWFGLNLYTDANAEE